MSGLGDERAWTAIALAIPPVGEICSFRIGDRDLLACNVDGQLFVIDARCPHAGAALADGSLRGCILECPLHGGKLDVRSGAPTAPPIRRPVPRYEARPHGDGFEVLLPRPISM